MRTVLPVIAFVLCACSGKPEKGAPAAEPGHESPALPGETHLRNIRQLTSDGTHAEAYFAPDGKKLCLQAKRDRFTADQVFSLDLATGAMKLLSTGKGKCTCSYFLPGGRYVYSSTHLAGDAPPPEPDKSKGYAWPLFREYEIFLADPKTGDLKRLTDNDGYDAEATPSPDGTRLVYTSHRKDGLWIYTMNVDGSDARRVSRRSGYIGGPVYSPDGQWILYRAYYPRTPEETKKLDAMLAERMLRPMGMAIEIYVCKVDGSEERAVTNNGKINFAPAFHPDGKHIIFSSNIDAKHPGVYGLYWINLDGSGLERITRHEGFDGFPCFSPDGHRLVWISNRNAKSDPRKDLNVFIADWVDRP
jgi:TolB protein